MLKWKTFIKGQGLNEELLCFSDQRIPKLQSVFPELDGNQVRKAYEEIVNEPTSASTCTSAPLKIYVPKIGDKTSASGSKSSTNSSTHPKRKPTITQLMRLCDKDQADKLSQEIGDFNVNSVDEFGWTLLMCAACAGSINCVRILLEAGTDWKLRDKSGQTALALAKKKRKVEVCDLLEKWAQGADNTVGSKFEKRISSEKTHTQQQQNGAESTKYCLECNLSYTSERIHSKSIAHLVGSSGNYRDKVHYGIPENNVGFQLMLKTGWDRQGGLGSEGQGQKFPVKTVLKRDRKGLGNLTDRKAARVTHFAPFDTAAVEKPDRDKRVERSRTLNKKADLKRKSKEKVKEIKFRRELNSVELPPEM